MQASAAVMMEQTIHSSCSPGDARPESAVLHAVAAHMLQTATAAAISILCLFLTAHSPCGP